MSNYVKSTNFTAKDSLPTGDTNKVIRGSEFDTEFNAIVTAISTKSDLAGPTFTGTATFADITGTGTINFTGATVSNLGSVTTVDINGGTIDGVTIGGSSAGAGTFSSLTATTADINGGTVDGVTIGGSSAGAGTFSSLTATTADINAGTVDNTVIGGTTPAAGTFSSLTATTANIDGGSIDGAVIGGSTPAAISGTTGTFSDAVSGTTGTFSGAVTGSNLNVSNWDTAFGWGDHSTQGYLTSVAFTDIDAGAVTLSSETFSDVDNQIPTNAAVIDYVAATIPLISEVNDLTAAVTWATVPDAFISASSVNQHVSVEKATQTKTYTNGESSAITLSSAVSSGAPVVSVTKEVPQTGVTNNNWGVNANIENYTRYNSAPTVTLTPSSVGDGTFTLGSGSFSSSDVGKTIEGNGGVATLIASDGSYITTTDFNDTTTIASGDWDLYAIRYNTAEDNLELSSYSDLFNFSARSQFTSNTFYGFVGSATSPAGIFFRPNGTRFWTVDNDNDAIIQWNLSSAWNGTLSYSYQFSVSSQTTSPKDIAVPPPGNYIFICQSNAIYRYTLGNGAYNLGTSTSHSQTYSSNVGSSATGIEFSDDGTKLFIVESSSANIKYHTMSTAYDLSTATFVGNYPITGMAASNSAIRFKDDGKRLLVLRSNGDMREWSLVTPYDITNASNITYVGSVVMSLPDSTTYGFDTDPTGLYLYTCGSNARFYSATIGSGTSVPSGYHAAHTTSSTDSTYWVDINSMAADETEGDGEIYYCVSTDDRTTWKVAHNTNGIRSVVRDNSGTWQYNSNSSYSSETWTNGSVNEELETIQEAMSISQNRMNKSQLEAVSDANQFPLGNDLDLAIIMTLSSGTSAPSSDGVSINYDANSLNQGAVLGTDYNWDFPATDKVRITSLGDYNLKVRII
jgi:hypothetical protein